ncbi:MAG: hypothetical protein JST10_12810 [Bacteroidetes bacterium]|nr:hypothetical protein [Bacteroidota bacterium]
MIDILNNILPDLNFLGSCNIFKGCSSPLNFVSREASPLSLPNIIDPFPGSNKITENNCPSFSDFFTIPDKDHIVDPNSLSPEIRHALDDKTQVFKEWLDSMDNLVLNGHIVLKCLLDMLCKCHPNINVYKKYEGQVKGEVAFAATTYADRDVRDPSDLDMWFYFDKINDPKKVQHNEFVWNAFHMGPRYIDLTLPYSTSCYNVYPWDHHFEIGILVHELGHVLDANSTRWKASFFDPGKHMHAFMWEAFYYQEFWIKYNPSGFPVRFISDPDQIIKNLDLPKYPITCSEIDDLLSKAKPII